MRYLKKCTPPVPSLIKTAAEYLYFSLLVVAFYLLVCSLVGCVALPTAPTTPLCIFVNTYTGKKLDIKSNDLVDDPAVKANPKLLGQVVPVVTGEHYYWRCINHKSTKFNVPVVSPSATNFVGTPFKDYLEMNAYINKMAAIFQKEVLSKVGKQ